MCSTPKLRQNKPKKVASTSLSKGMSQSSYSKMIKQANEAYKKSHPDTFDMPIVFNKRKKSASKQKPISYWFTKASLSEISQLLARNINIH